MAVAIVGSANVDYVVAVERIPHPGETVLGGDLEVFSGGKGANQAVAAHRLGAAVTFIGCVGNDPDAEIALRNLTNVDTSHVTRSDRPTGVALIAVDPDGENQIVVSPGANAALTSSAVEAASQALSTASVTVAQLEVPIDAVATAARLAGGLMVLNPAPAQALSAELLAEVDILVPNRTELAALVGRPVATDLDEVQAQASLLDAEVVVTLGADGAFVAAEGRTELVAPPTVDAVDATGAGDSFCAALAVRLDQGASLFAATEFAVRVGAATTLRRGAQPSLPTLDELDNLL